MTETVHLTPEAAERFPDIGTRSGTVVVTHMDASWPAWVLVAWDGGITAWLPTEELTTVPAAPRGDGGPRSGPECRAREADGREGRGGP